MLELLDLTLADLRHQERQQEFLRLREILCDVFQGENVSNTSRVRAQEINLLKAG